MVEKKAEYVYTPVVTALCGCAVYGAEDLRVVPCVAHRAGDPARRILEAISHA